MSRGGKGRRRLGPRRLRFVPLLALGMLGCVTAGDPEAPASPYGRWTYLAGAPVFHYTGPVTAPQRDHAGRPQRPLHLLGNSAFSAIVDAAGGLRWFVRGGGPLWLGTGTTEANLGGLLACGERLHPWRRRERGGPLWFGDRGVTWEVTTPTVHLREEVRFMPGATWAAERRWRASSPSGCRYLGLWSFVPTPLLAAPIYNAQGEAAIVTQRRAYVAERWRAAWRRSSAGLEIRFTAPTVTAPADFGPPPELLLALPATATVYPLLDTDPWQLGAPVTAGWRAVAPVDLVFVVDAGDAGGATLHLSWPASPTAPGWLRSATAPPPVPLMFAGEAVPAWWTRELAWHGRSLVAGGACDGGLGRCFVDQGSAYLYLQGLSGAVRDLVLHALAVVETAPELARETLAAALGFVRSDGHVHYLLHGYGTFDDAGVRTESTDLPIWLLWGAARYVASTGDWSFLEETVAYADGGTGTVAARMQLLARYLLTGIGTGADGWIRVGTGDWSDGILLFSDDPALTRERGESFFNTALALWTLPVVVPFLAAVSATTASELATWLAELRAAAEGGWRADRGWYVRGAFGDGGYLGEEQLFLESNALALAARLGDAERRTRLVAAIVRMLDAPEPIGARNVAPPSERAALVLEPGWDVNGGIWPALQGLLVAGYAVVDPARAWAALLESSLARHGEVYPEIWFGNWTGPDSYNAADAERPGETFVHLATPMAGFPAANMNVHSGPILGQLALMGLWPEAGVVRLEPALPFARWRYRSALWRIDWGPDEIRLWSRRRAGWWRIRLPDDWPGACLGTVPLTVDAGAVMVALGREEVRLRPCG